MSLPIPTITDDNRRWWTLGAMCFALFMIMLDNTVVNVALPSIQRGLHASTSSLEWTVNAYTLTFALTLVTGGRLGDIYGRRRMFLFGVAVFGASSFLIGLAQSDVWLIVFRATQGIGSGFMMPATLSIITNTFDARERGRAIGTWAGVSAMALAIGPVVGGFLVQEVSWQSIFFLNVPVAILAIIVTLAAARESRDESAVREVDIPGVLTLTIALAGLVLGLIQSNEWGWGSARVLGLFALAVAMLAAFVYVERRRSAPMVDFSFFRSRSFFGANVVAFIVSFAMFAMFFFLALYMQDVLRYSPLQAGVRFLPSTVMIMIVAPIAGRMADRIGSRPLMTVGLILVSFALFWLTGITTHTGYGYLSVSFIVMGVGMGLVMSPMSTAAMNSVQVAKAGVASGILSMTRMVGSTFGVAVLGAVIATLGRTHLQTALPHVPAAARERLANALGSGASGAGLPAHIQTVMGQTYVYALSNALYVAAGLALLGALLAWVLVAAHPSSGEAVDWEPATGQARVAAQQQAPQAAGHGQTAAQPVGPGGEPAPEDAQSAEPLQV